MMQRIQTQSRQVRVFSAFLALYPILCLYKAFGNFTIGDVLLILFIGWHLLTTSVFANAPKVFIIYGLYIIVSLLLNILTTTDLATVSQYGEALVRCIKLLFYIFGILCLGGARMVDSALFRKWMVIIGILSTLFLFFQYVMFLGAGRIVMGWIPWLELQLGDYADIDFETKYSFDYRPCSFFLEPAMLAQYVIVSLAVLLFDRQPFKHRSLLAVMLTLCIILSTSAQGILYLALVLATYFIFFLRNRSIAAIMIVLIIIAAFVGYEIIEPMKFAVDRLLHGENAAEARFGSYSYCFNLDFWDMLFGKGYGCIPDGKYLAGAAYVWYGAGITGLVIAICLFVSVYHKCKMPNSRIITLLFFVMMWGTALFYNYMIWWFFTIIISLSYPALDKSKQYA